MAIPDVRSSSEAKAPTPLEQAPIYLLGFAVCVIAFWPGFLSADSLDQYAQAKLGIYHDWHPPLMSFVWSRLLIFADGPQPMLLLHVGFMWLALWLLATRFAKTWRATLIFFVVGLLPWLANFEGVIWKDVSLATSWLLAIALLSTKSPGRFVTAATGLLLFYGIAVRHNAIFGAPPLIFLFLRYGIGIARTNVRTMVFAIALSLGFAAANAFAIAMIGARHVNPSGQIMIDDLHSMSVRTGTDLFPPSVDVDSTLIGKCRGDQVSIVFCYQRNGWSHGDTAAGFGHFHGFLSSDEYAALRTQWLVAVARHPTVYARSRLSSFRGLMRGSDPPFLYWQSGTLQNSLGITEAPNVLTRALDRAVHVTATRLPIVMKPYFWTLLALLVLAMAVKTRSEGQPFVIGLLSSALLYTFAYLPITTAFDFRFAYWPVVATNVAIAIFLVGRRRTFLDGRHAGFSPELRSRIWSTQLPGLTGRGAVSGDGSRRRDR
jgi:hypothetical protein